MAADKAQPRPDVRGAHSPVQVIAVTGGKGGVGKTTIAVNLATSIAARGKQVMLLDGDLGLANVDVFLGLTPRLTLADVLAGSCTLEEILLDTFVTIDLEAIPVESVVLLLTSDVMHRHIKWLSGSFVGLGLAHICWMMGTAIAGVFVVIRVRIDMMLLGLRG